MSIFSSRRYRNQLPHSLSSPKRKWSPVSQASVRLHAGPSGEQHNLLQRGQAFLSKSLTSFISAVYVLSLTSFSQENILLAFQLSQQRRQTSSLSRRGQSINASWTLWEFFTLTTCEQGRVVLRKGQGRIEMNLHRCLGLGARRTCPPVFVMSMNG